jgi:hypothetical protein
MSRNFLVETPQHQNCSEAESLRGNIRKEPVWVLSPVHTLVRHNTKEITYVASTLSLPTFVTNLRARAF